MSNLKTLTLKEKQDASLEVLLYLHKFCEEHSITYYLAYGTLIGAVRHHGFIPWDDDVDVLVPRPDYELLLNIFCDPTGTFKLFSCTKDRDYVLPYAKIQNLKTARLTPNGMIVNQGIGIDLFPLDALPDDLEAAKRTFKEKNDKFVHIVHRFEMFRYMKPSSIKDYLKIFIGKISFATGYLRKVGQEAGADMFGCDYRNSKKVSSVVGIHSGIFRVFEKKWFDKMYMTFEGHELVVPAGYNEILKLIYRDYTQLPPESERESTHTDSFVWR